MKCEMECTNKAKLKISQSNGTSQCLCFRHAFTFIKYLIRRLGTGPYDFGIYIQQPPTPQPPRVIAPEARHRVFTPDDRAESRASGEKGEWDW